MNGAAAPWWRRWLPALATAVLLTASTPPAWWPGCEFLVLPAWMAFYALFTGAPRPLRQAYWLGVLHMLAFSWSLRHVMWLGWLAVGLIGGVYYVLLVLGTRRLSWLGGPFAFGTALAVVHWLRANMPEIYYPHGQPCHALWQHPWLLGPVAWGGEVLANFLLGALAAALVQLWRSWRLAATPWRLTCWRAAAVAATWLFACAVPPPRAAAAPAASIDVVAVEPGVHPTDPYRELVDYQQQIETLRELFRARLLQPTLAVAGADVAQPPELVLWPESSMPGAGVKGHGAAAHFVDELARPRPQLARGVRLCLGAEAEGEGDAAPAPAAVLLDAHGRYLAHQEKLRLVPAGERLPLVSLLPDSWNRAVRDYVKATMGQVPDVAPGRLLPPLRTAAGVPFGTLMCYDNAYPEVAAAHVAQGARLLAVLSNEAWYRGGGELQQLVAMTVLRALETGTPIVRCTTDGLTMLVDPGGHIEASLPLQPAPAPAPRTLRISVAAGPGTLPPLAWLRPWLAALAVALFAAAILHPLLVWARLLAVRAKSTAAGGDGSPTDTGIGGA